MWGVCSWCIPDIKVILYSIESQSGKALYTVTVVVQCDGSQGDSCGEYEQHLPIPPSNPHIMGTATELLVSKIRVSQSKLGAITVDVYDTLITNKLWILPTVGTATLSSVDRVMTIGIL